MKCDNCQETLNEGSKFCNSCGAKIETKKDIVAQVRESNESLLRESGLMWFTVGFIKGNCARSEKTKKHFKETIEKDIRNNPRFAELYDYINSEYNKLTANKKQR